MFSEGGGGILHRQAFPDVVLAHRDATAALASASSAAAAALCRRVAGSAMSVSKTGAWCRITGEGFDGWIEQERLWGVYPNEKVE